TVALLKLARGGEVRICPATSLTATSGKRGELTLGVGTGVIEIDYELQSNADTLLTPDFRLLFAGPGKFHIAAGARANGDTCLKSLQGSAASVIVSEQMGDGTFQLRPGDAVLFRGGRISEILREPGLECGCPAPVPVVLAEKKTAPAVSAPPAETKKPPERPVTPVAAVTPVEPPPQPVARERVLVN